MLSRRKLWFKAGRRIGMGTAKKSTGFLLTLLLAIVVAACAPRALTTPAEYVGGERSAVAPGAPDYAAPVSDANEATDAEDRMIVRSANVSLVVMDTENSVARIKSIVSALGGYVVGTQLWRDEGQLRGSVSVRVPSESLEDALSQFKALAVKVERETSNSQDVTEEYTDLSARLRNLEATEQELLELLGTVRERTGKAEDILAVYRELTNIRGQIEQLKGRMQYLERTSAMAAVTLELIPDVLAQPIAGTGWRPSATVAGALRSLLGTLRFLADAAIVIVFYVLPVVVVLLIPVAIVWLVWRRWRKRKSAAKS
jgi:hypothetical protein